MATLNEWALKVQRQVRLDIAPDAQGWDPSSNDLRSLCEAALVTVGHPSPTGSSGRDVRDIVVARVLNSVAPGYRSRRDTEEAMWSVQMDAALAQAGSYFVEEVAAGRPGQSGGD